MRPDPYLQRAVLAEMTLRERRRHGRLLPVVTYPRTDGAGTDARTADPPIYRRDALTRPAPHEMSAPGQAGVR